MFKCAVFGIKPTYNHKMFIPHVQLHSTKISFEGSGEADLK